MFSSTINIQEKWITNSKLIKKMFGTNISKQAIEFIHAWFNLILLLIRDFLFLFSLFFFKFFFYLYIDPKRIKWFFHKNIFLIFSSHFLLTYFENFTIIIHLFISHFYLFIIQTIYKSFPLYVLEKAWYHD